MLVILFNMLFRKKNGKEKKKDINKEIINF